MAAAKTSHSGGAHKLRRRISKNVTNGHAYIRSTFNNIIVSLMDPTGAVVAWTSSGQVGSGGSRKPTSLAAQLAAGVAAHRVQEYGMKKIDVSMKDLGSDREITIRSLQVVGLKIGSIQDVTPQALNGTHPPKRRRG